ncbi:MAG TPA: electron transfer flavoprotein subunit beta [Polyangia bacterium]
MKIFVPVQFVPDLVEELVIDASGDRLDPYSIRWKLNEFDEHAVEQAILLKEKFGGQVTVLAPDFEGADDALYAAAAKGADRLVKLCANFEGGANTHALAHLFLPSIQQGQPDLVLTGVQAINSLDGAVGGILAGLLDWPYVGYVSSVAPSGKAVLVQKDFPGGLTAQVEVQLPAVLGIQAAETPPRYVPISKVRLAMKASKIEEQEGELEPAGGLAAERLFPPVAAAHATMLEGDVEQVADQIVSILREQGLV